MGGVALGASGFPEKLIEVPALDIPFGRNDALMLQLRHSTTAGSPDFWPCLLGQNRPCQPAEIDGQIVESAQVVVGGVSTSVHDAQEVLTGRGNEGLIPNEVEALAAHSTPAALLSGCFAVACHFGHDIAPCARGHLRVMCGGVCLRKGEIESRLFKGLVLGVKQFERTAFIFGAETPLLFGLIVLPVKNPALALEQSES